MSDPLPRARLLSVAVVLLAAMAGLMYRLGVLHLGNHDKLKANVDRLRHVERRIVANRGQICDCHGTKNILALNLCVKDVCADPQVVVTNRAVAAVASVLADTLDLPADEVAVRLNHPKRRYTCIKHYVRAETVESLATNAIEGVFFRDQIIRFYPNDAFMCHVLGFVNHEGIGSAGVEQFLDEYLKGSPGMRESRLNALNKEIYWEDGRSIPAIAGADVVLNLDQNVQYMVEKALDEVMEEHHAKAAWSIVQRVRTGQILAMASRPAYNLNDFGEAGKSAWLNRAVGCVYEPGSTFKAVVFSAALNEGSITPDTLIDCENGAWSYCGKILRDHGHHSMMTAADGLKKSSNIMAAKIALRLGEKRYYKYLRAYHIGQKMGVDLPGEENGILHPQAEWSGISATRIAIGQGVAVTALQLLGVYSAIANDGHLMRPYVVRSVLDRDGGVLLEPTPETLGRPVSTETAATMRRLLARVTEEGGTGCRARVDGYTVAGKTGTAQKPVNGRYSDSAHVASFVGFLPAEAPELAIVVVVDEPQPQHYGGTVAAPVFSKIAGQAVRYLNIPPAGFRVARAGLTSVGGRP